MPTDEIAQGDLGSFETSVADESPLGDVTVREASRATGVMRDELRRRAAAGDFLGAWRENTARGHGTGAWRIPFVALAARYDIDHSRVPLSCATLAEAEREIRRLRVELAQERSLRRAAETQARECGDALKTAENALRLDNHHSQRPSDREPAHRRLRGNWLR
jgi:hypothetical protein